MPLPLSEHTSLDGKKKAKVVRQLHEKVRANIEKFTEQFARHANKGCRQLLFKPGDWVWLHMRKERFPEKRRSKLMPHGDGPFQILDKVNDNAYQLDLPGEYGVSSTFNVADLLPFDVDDDFDLRINSSQEEGTDEDLPWAQVVTSKGSSEDALCAPSMNLGPMTRARARKMRETLQTFLQIIHTCIGRIQEPNHTMVSLLQVHEKAADD
ncbi:uncharacterized protein [Coffea arabica]|uniref:Tf2-1-like SH3-like domain-containing protein n=1 Tax=Coffea arabica TaxID=13443 RepID=A0ABM4V9M1_COFAR